MAQVVLEKVVKRYGSVQVVHGIDLTVQDKEFVVLVGPSGCAKSTTLRMVAGLEEISAGTIRIGDRVVNEVPPKNRDVAMVFQDYALYPHMSVYDNMAFSLKMRRKSPAEIKLRVKEAAEILGLTDFLKRRPAALSGGQRQRVAMGRAIVRDPSVFLFDEPLSNLDAKLRTQMRTEIKKLHLKLNTTTIYVTHDQVEAMTLADRIVIMRDGYIMQVGTPIEVYEKPANNFVATFIGNPSMNQVRATVRGNGATPALQLDDLRLPLPDARRFKLSRNQSVTMGLRPEAIFMTDRTTNLPDEWCFDGEVVLAEVIGGTSLLEIKVHGVPLMAEIEGRVLPRPGEHLRFGLDLNQIHLFDQENGKTLSQ